MRAWVSRGGRGDGQNLVGSSLKHPDPGLRIRSFRQYHRGDFAHVAPSTREGNEIYHFTFGDRGVKEKEADPLTTCGDPPDRPDPLFGGANRHHLGKGIRQHLAGTFVPSLPVGKDQGKNRHIFFSCHHNRLLHGGRVPRPDDLRITKWFHFGDRPFKRAREERFSSRGKTISQDSRTGRTSSS